MSSERADASRKAFAILAGIAKKQRAAEDARRQAASEPEVAVKVPEPSPSEVEAARHSRRLDEQNAARARLATTTPEPRPHLIQPREAGGAIRIGAGAAPWQPLLLAPRASAELRQLAQAVDTLAQAVEGLPGAPVEALAEVRRLVAGITGGEAAHGVEAHAAPAPVAKREKLPPSGQAIGAAIARGVASAPPTPPTPAQLTLAAERAGRKA